MSSATRLTFLYPHLFRTATKQTARGSGYRIPSTSPAPATANTSQRCSFSTTRPRRATFAPRSGKAVEPPKQPDNSSGSPNVEPPSKGPAEPRAATESKTDTSASASQAAGSRGDMTRESSVLATSHRPSESLKSSSAAPEQQQQNAQEAQQSQPPQPPSSDPLAAAAASSSSSGPLDSILAMPPPEEVARQHPHLSPPPYVHHFDSYSLVKKLHEKGGYTEEQAITAMKAIRSLLAQNLDVAQDTLVSKSDVENEMYLFRAACSELSNEVRKSRRIADEQMRQQRTALLHESDILGQRLTQEMLRLGDAVRGMFNDRKMAVREEQRAIESSIQRLNYRIGVDLNSEAKSDIESLRWVLIRRSAWAIIFMAVLTLGTLRYASYVIHEREREAEAARRELERIRGGARSGDAADAARIDRSAAPDAGELLATN